MKILLFAQERPAAELVSRALRRIAPDATLAWARSADAALTWLGTNRDAGLVIVDASIPAPRYEVLLDQARAIGPDLSSAVLVPQHLEALSRAFKANLDAAAGEERTRNDLLETQLRELQEWRTQAQLRLTQVQADHDGALSRTARICTTLQERLLEVEGALERADRQRAEQAATAEQLAGREAELSTALVEAAAIRTAIERRLTETEAAFQDARRDAERELAAAAGRYATLEDRLTREASLRASLEERLATSADAKENADQRYAAEIAALTARLTDGEARSQAHQASLARTGRICTALQERLLDLESATRVADERRAADAAEIDRLTTRERELAAALADAGAVRTALEHRLTEAGAEQQQTAGERTRALERAAALETELADVTAARSKLEGQLAESAAALEDVRRNWAREVAALSEQLTRREAETAAALADAIANRTAVEERLSAAETAHERALQSAAADLAAAAGRYAALEEHLRQQASVRSTLEERLAAADVAGRNAEAHHADRKSVV